MARPREFDETTVLDKALDAFWARGFEGTSIEDLVEATGLGRASLYGAFGDKEQLFKRVLDHYLAKIGQAMPADARTARDTLAAFFDDRIHGMCPKNGPRGCFLLLSGTAGDSADLAREAAVRAGKETERVIAHVIRRGQEAGEIDPKADAAVLARFLGVVLNGLATSARAGVPVKELEAVAREALDHATPKPPGRRAHR